MKVGSIFLMIFMALGAVLHASDSEEFSAKIYYKGPGLKDTEIIRKDDKELEAYVMIGSIRDFPPASIDLRSPKDQEVTLPHYKFNSTQPDINPIKFYVSDGVNNTVPTTCQVDDSTNGRIPTTLNGQHLTKILIDISLKPFYWPESTQIREYQKTCKAIPTYQ